MPTIEWKVPIEFGSSLDEKAFFAWLESIPGVTRVDGNGTGLLIRLRSRRLSKNALRELVAIYRRYGGDLSEMAQFRDSESQKPAD
jgi:hypothetical protein